MSQQSFKNVADRAVAAYDGLVRNLADLGKVSQDEARRAARYYVKHRIVKLDVAGSRYVVSHGIYFEADVIQRAAAA